VWIRDRGYCQDCGTFLEYDSGWHLDHWIPLKRGGTHVMANVRVLCPPCNLSKNARMPMGPFRLGFTDTGTRPLSAAIPANETSHSTKVEVPR
jgi:5-methylcytosine-specific restriction endonuclease McrA